MADWMIYDEKRRHVASFVRFDEFRAILSFGPKEEAAIVLDEKSLEEMRRGIDHMLEFIRWSRRRNIK